jgi:NAD(P)-dependent dehydrogenase (short-subunit alcohol dehydrogenase family)
MRDPTGHNNLVDHAIAGIPSVLTSVTKSGLNAATKSLAIEYAKRGVRVNAVALGIIKTPMHPVEVHAQLGALRLRHRGRDPLTQVRPSSERDGVAPRS